MRSGSQLSDHDWHDAARLFALRAGTLGADVARFLGRGRKTGQKITATYLGVGWEKVWLPGWQGGSVLQNSMMNMWATPLAMWMVRTVHPSWVYTLLMKIVTAFECLLPFGLWYKPARRWFCIGGILFHLLLVMLLGMWWFLAMIATYHLFIDSDEFFVLLQQRLPRLTAKTSTHV